MHTGSACTYPACMFSATPTPHSHTHTCGKQPSTADTRTSPRACQYHVCGTASAAAAPARRGRSHFKSGPAAAPGAHQAMPRQGPSKCSRCGCKGVESLPLCGCVKLLRWAERCRCKTSACRDSDSSKEICWQPQQSRFTASVTPPAAAHTAGSHPLPLADSVVSNTLVRQSTAAAAAAARLHRSSNTDLFLDSTTPVRYLAHRHRGNAAESAQAVQVGRVRQLCCWVGPPCGGPAAATRSWHGLLGCLGVI